MSNKTTAQKFQDLVLNVSVVFVSVVMFGIGIGILMLVQTYLNPTDNPTSHPVLNSVSHTLIGVSVISVIWELVVRKALIKDVVSIVELSQNLYESGISQVGSKFPDINWENFYLEAKRVDLIVFHAQHTLLYNESYIRKLAEKGIKLRVKIPNIENKELICQLASLESNNDPIILTRKIRDTIRDFQQIAAEYDKSNIKILYVDFPFPFSMYKTDKQSVVVLTKEPSFQEPIVMLKSRNDGPMYEFIDTNYKRVCDTAVEITDSNFT